MNGLFWEGDFESSFIPHILKEIYLDRVYDAFLHDAQGKPKSGLTIVDAGANVGLTSMYFARFAARVIAIEPNPNHVCVLREMIEVNNLDQIEVVPLALSDHDGIVPFFKFPGNETMGCLIPGNGWHVTAPVHVTSLASLFDAAEFDMVDLFKLDIEGGEAAVVRSPDFAELAPRIKTWVGEWHTWSDIGRAEMQERFEAAGYRFCWRGGGGASMFAAVRG